MVARLRLLVLCVVLAPVNVSAAPVQPRPFTVVVEKGIRTAPDGTTVDYVLYFPQFRSARPAPPWPAVVLTHGFARDFGRMLLAAMALAERGVVVLTPTMPSLLDGVSSRQAAIDLTKGHVAWLVQRSATRGDPLYRRVDRKRLGLAGHSAGGAVSLEAAWELQATATPVAALVLLDAVPWARTVTRAGSLAPIAVLSLRAPASACNAGASGARLVSALPFASFDVLVVGSTHCDPEAPTDIACSLVCGGTSAGPRAAFQDLTGAFFRTAFGMPPVGPGADAFPEALARLVTSGRLEVVSRP